MRKRSFIYFERNRNPCHPHCVEDLFYWKIRLCEHLFGWCCCWCCMLRLMVSMLFWLVFRPLLHHRHRFLLLLVQLILHISIKTRRIRVFAVDSIDFLVVWISWSFKHDWKLLLCVCVFNLPVWIYKNIIHNSNVYMHEFKRNHFIIIEHWIKWLVFPPILLSSFPGLTPHKNQKNYCYYY